MRTLGTTILWTVTAFYAYGALVHVLNMLSLNGFDWPNAPTKWQALDVAYLLLDLIVVAGLARRRRLAIATFYLAATSRSYLDLLVGFHVTALGLVTLALRVRAPRDANANA